MRMVEKSTLDLEEEDSILLTRIGKDTLRKLITRFSQSRIMKGYLKFIQMEDKFTQDQGVGGTTIQKLIGKSTSGKQSRRNKCE